MPRPWSACPQAAALTRPAQILCIAGDSIFTATACSPPGIRSATRIASETQLHPLTRSRESGEYAPSFFCSFFGDSFGRDRESVAGRRCTAVDRDRDAGNVRRRREAR
jgi:hypothetical protein